MGKIQILVAAMTNGGVIVDGVGYGCKYFPASGEVSARVETLMYVNHDSYNDAAGNRVEGRTERLRVTIWNSRKATAGKGLADVMARNLSIGKTLTNCELTRRPYQIQQRDANGTLMVNLDGTPRMLNREAYSLTQFDFGKDSHKTIMSEIAAFTGEINFNSRPAYWDGKPRLDVPARLNAQGQWDLPSIQADQSGWEQIVAWRKSVVFNPASPIFGYAIIATAQAAAPAPVTPGVVLPPPAQAGAPVQLHQPLPPTQVAPVTANASNGGTLNV